MLLASPDPGVVCPVFGILLLAVYVVGNLIEWLIRRLWQRRKQQNADRRGFEVKLTAGTPPVSQRKDNDHG